MPVICLVDRDELKAKAEQAMRIEKLKAQIAELEKQLEDAE